MLDVCGCVQQLTQGVVPGGERPHLASCGLSAAWRMGRWEAARGYLRRMAAAKGCLEADERWEARLGQLLCDVQSRWGPWQAHAAGS